MAGKISGLSADIKIDDFKREFPNVGVEDNGISGLLDDEDRLQVVNVERLEGGGVRTSWSPITPEGAVGMYLSKRKQHDADWEKLVSILSEFKNTVPHAARGELPNWEKSEAFKQALLGLAEKLQALSPDMIREISREISTSVDRIDLYEVPSEKNQNYQRFSNRLCVDLSRLIEARFGRPMTDVASP